MVPWTAMGRATLQLPADARGRLLGGLAAAIVDKGYAAATIADVVRHARMSKRTFYEHFADKEACYLALYTVISDHLLDVITRGADTDLPWRERLNATARSYLEELAAEPALTRAFLLEIQAAGPRALARRREVHRRFATVLLELTERAAAEEPAFAPLTPGLAIAVVGGINELLIESLADPSAPALPELADTATELLVGVLTARALAP